MAAFNGWLIIWGVVIAYWSVYTALPHQLGCMRGSDSIDKGLITGVLHTKMTCNSAFRLVCNTFSYLPKKVLADGS